MMNNMMKKATIVIAAAVMALTSMACIASANDGMGIDAMTADVAVQDMHSQKYVASEWGANVRTAPTTDARVVKTLDFNDQVFITGVTSNGWYQISESDPVYGGVGSYYICGDLVSDEAQYEQNYGYASGITAEGEFRTNNAGTPDYVNTMENRDYKETYTVCVDGYLALRSEPAFNYDNEFAQLHTGDVVNVKENYGTYWCVYVPETGMLGFVNSNYLV